ncbi:hypothetical protein [Chelativorans salis]|uniref:hypothetical protein n=1 Tax=Chelativorans salis TaxID=2978478 RepID=UPI0028CBA648|nr:hypothetical protein [Chelativorans sp. EGI FJ00035]
MDRMITAAINGPAGTYPLLDSLTIAVTQLGVPAIVLIVALQWWNRKDRLHVRHVAVTASLSFVLGLAEPAYPAFRRSCEAIRRGGTPPHHCADPSFPSDHATVVAAVVVGGVLTGIAAEMLVRMLYRKGSRLDAFVSGVL